jgi:hypothetical protein
MDAINNGHALDACKILALPEHFSPKHLQDIVDGKLKEGKVLVECELHVFADLGAYDCGGDLTDDVHKINRIKLNSSNHITLHKVEEKMYTGEEVKRIAWKSWHQCMIENCTTGTESDKNLPTLEQDIDKPVFDKWFEQNIK